jgi:signal transduction histidine kinase
MRIGIRRKLIMLLVAVALLPLLAALVTIIVVGQQLRSDIFGKGVLSQAQAEARVMETKLLKSVEALRIALQEKPVLYQLRQAKPLDQAQVAELEQDWSRLPEDEGPLRRVLVNSTSDVLNIIQRNNDRLVELLVTDRWGQIVAATQRTEDFHQADETWWQQTHNDGAGRIFVSGVNYDRSAMVWAIDLCIPILDEGKVVGVVKAVLDLQRWLPDCTRRVSGEKAQLLLLSRDGYVMHSQQTLQGEIEPGTQQRSGWAERTSPEQSEHWWASDDGMLEAYAPLELPDRMDRLEMKTEPMVVLVSMPVSEARRGLTRLTLVMLAIGLVSIGGLFMAGVLLIDRSIINRIKRISSSARHVAGGELHHRADSSWAGTRLFGTDEIEDLARDFNNMVRKLQHSHQELTEANQLKENFIRIAGHELRTPVSYIVGMASLMKNCDEPDRLRKAIDTMGFKAGRLDEIIQAMFKLIPEQSLAEGTQYEEVNLSELLEEVYLDCQPWLERRNQRLVVEPGEDDTRLFADKGKLRDIIENIAMNAIKFTPNDGVVKIAVQRQLGGYVAIEITDQGPGIPESDRPHIFEPFYSGSDVLKHSTGKSGYGKRGMGLGLAIVKHFVELHGGTIEFFTSSSGTKFVVQLPIEPPEKSSHRTDRS